MPADSRDVEMDIVNGVGTVRSPADEAHIGRDTAPETVAETLAKLQLTAISSRSNNHPVN